MTTLKTELMTLNESHQDKLRSTDRNGMLIFSIPVVTLQALYEDQEPVTSDTHLTIYQRYSEIEDIFCLESYDELYPMGDVALGINPSGGQQPSSEKIERLLKGEVLRFTEISNPGCWIEVQLAP